MASASGDSSGSSATESKISTPDQLIDKLKTQVETHRGSGDEKKRVVLICVDSSESSLYACQWASENVLGKRDIVVLMTVWEELMDLSAMRGAGTVDPIGLVTIDSAEIKKQNTEHLKEAQKLLLSIYTHYLKGCAMVMPLLVSSIHGGKGYIGKLVISAAGVLNADLIVTGSRGLGKIEGMLMGSVSKHIVENSVCPVLVVKH